LYLKSGSNFIGNDWQVGTITASRVSFRKKIVPNKLTKKQYFLRFLLETWDCKSFGQYYLIPTEILSVINSRERGFPRMMRVLQSDAVIWFQRYQRSDLKRGSISLARQIGWTRDPDGRESPKLIFIPQVSQL
jgi:hypothetical protein